MFDQFCADVAAGASAGVKAFACVTVFMLLCGGLVGLAALVGMFIRKGGGDR